VLFFTFLSLEFSAWNFFPNSLLPDFYLFVPFIFFSPFSPSWLLCFPYSSCAQPKHCPAPPTQLAQPAIDPSRQLSSSPSWATPRPAHRSHLFPATGSTEGRFSQTVSSAETGNPLPNPNEILDRDRIRCSYELQSGLHTR
jgi:hypothetical protein